ncbi:co-chaperone GrpE [Capnocytophaga sputigena ATCC 33612]|uniref:Protein GrpE n=3 Tax=Capnocytophaga sputigena TaxID=1019 RepID=A0AAX2I929_CAPSP|nr:nucleotide exchange factor GrpE [Capnocytophaga sputigena]EEB64452.1 co-chaperone GrpE [Capnocytophaga sputigena ATCC 33612]SQA74900.1 HSP-70 cofactor [Capnocytophaga sputigena]
MSTEDINKDDFEFEQDPVDYTPEEDMYETVEIPEDEDFDDFNEDEMPFDLDDDDSFEEEPEAGEELEEPETEEEDSEEEQPEEEEDPEESFEDEEFEEEPETEEEPMEQPPLEDEPAHTSEPTEEEQIMYKDPNEPEKTDEYFNKERDRYLRLFAEFDNYRRRTIKEREELIATAGKDILSAMLPIVDDFDRALVELSKTADENTLEGVKLIYNKLINTLKSKGLERMDVAPNDVFDSEIHDAITLIPAPSPEYKGRIVDVVQAGYKLGDKVIRFPKVVVAQ